MDFFCFTIYVGLMIVIQIVISLYIFDNVNLDRLAARFPFLKKKLFRATIVGFTMGNLGKVFDYPWDYLIIVSVHIRDVTYRTRIVRGEADEIGKDVEIIVYGEQISVAGRSERVVPYRKQKSYSMFFWI